MKFSFETETLVDID
ncbi:Protein of unknown function [Leuconostoc citreum LBAE C11]|nr:Protein of unknown function [Leuconostoc citreum LBAE C11]